MVIFVFGAFILSAAVYFYAVRIEKTGHHGRTPRGGKIGRDMWAATLLDCDYEPAKVRFGPAKVIPADRMVLNASHKEDFSKHMASK